MGHRTIPAGKCTHATFEFVINSMKPNKAINPTHLGRARLAPRLLLEADKVAGPLDFIFIKNASISSKTNSFTED